MDGAFYVELPQPTESYHPMNKFILILMSALVFYGGLQFSPRLSANADYRAGGTVVNSAPTVPPVLTCEHQNICDVLLEVGFPIEQAKVMYAIGRCESAYRIDAKGDISLQNAKWSYSYGIFQIRLLNAPGGEWWRDKHFVEASLLNQAKAAYAISGSGRGNFYPWSTHQNGCYKQYL